MPAPRSARPRLVAGPALAVALAAAGLTAAFAPATPDEPRRLSGLRLHPDALTGFVVADPAGVEVGRAAGLVRDHRGRSRYLDLVDPAGATIRLASFRAWVDFDDRRIELTQPRDLVYAAAGLPERPLARAQIAGAAAGRS
jgi:hypothetical protein